MLPRTALTSLAMQLLNTVVSPSHQELTCHMHSEAAQDILSELLLAHVDPGIVMGDVQHL